MAVQGIPVDQELKKAFQELQTKMITTRQQLKFSDAQVETLKRQITHSKLLDQEISILPEDTRTYEGVGRMFMLQPIPEVRKNLTKKIQTADEKIKSINSNKSYLERSIKESEDNLREMILSKQSNKWCCLYYFIFISTSFFPILLGKSLVLFFSYFSANLSNKLFLKWTDFCFVLFFITLLSDMNIIKI